MPNKVIIKNWGELNGQEIFLFELRNANDMHVSITNLGASIQSIFVPDDKGNFEDVALGYDNLEGYINDPFYMGAVVGRFASRIAGGKVEIEGKIHQLTIKDAGFHHHGGKEGFNKKIWNAKPFTNEQGEGVALEYFSKDGEEGFPGNLLTRVTYTLNNQNQLQVDFCARTDKTTIINLTQHAYFNLAGHASGSITSHKLTLPLTHYLPVNAMLVPIGKIAEVEQTPFDFRKSTTIGERINSDHPQLTLGKGYDHSWVIKKNDSEELKLAASLLDPVSKRLLNVFTTEPAIHLYTGNFLNNELPGKLGAHYHARTGLCLETQHYPDAPNHPNFPNTLLKPEAPFQSCTIFEFIIDHSPHK